MAIAGFSAAAMRRTYVRAVGCPVRMRTPVTGIADKLYQLRLGQSRRGRVRRGPLRSGLRDRCRRHWAAQPVDFARAEEHRCVVESRYEAAHATKHREERHDAGNNLLKPREIERPADLDAPPVPEQLIILVDTEPPEIFQADLLDARGPAGRGLLRSWGL